MNATFIIQKSMNNQFYFNLVAPNNEVIGTSETYHKKKACYSGINSVRANAQFRHRFEEKFNQQGQHWFTLEASNGKTILTSEMYQLGSGCINGIKAVQKYAPLADVIEKYQKTVNHE